MTGFTHKQRLKQSLFSLLMASYAATAWSEPNDYIRLPTVEYGEREIDFKSGYQKNRPDGSDSANSIGYGFTPTRWWFTELYAKYHRPAGEQHDFDAWELENRFQLTETGKYPVDVGFLLEIERPKDRDEGYEITYGPMFQKEFGKYQANLNFFLEKHVRSTERSFAEFRYQGQFKYRYHKELEWGGQVFGNTGPWRDWSNHSTQTHLIGPALFGKMNLTNKQALKWNTAYLVGTTNASPKRNVRLQAEYEF